ncbi:class I SAM-dependent methyltransferase [Microvirga sp. 17 mud 1-3]|uniref:class I SAM-dependent methyltransferase n=1 Tax=Microvirga sp. 17 mud 1-3 TaxID=2082949 RepID=UPI001AECF8D5|nr:class I SAM-dependent methyltransferase [Microvirga sp. 17 mud 1-3]
MSDPKKINERVCPACGARESVHFADERLDNTRVTDYTYASRKQPEFMCHRLVRCTSCNLIYAPAPPDLSFLTSAYAEAAYDSAEEARCAAESYANALAPYVSELTSRTAAIDIGAGNGYLLSWFLRWGFGKAIGVEPSKAAIDAAPEEIRPLLREGMFSAEIVADVRPSLVCSFMTLEHVSEPGQLMRTVYELLEPGGLVAVVVHNWRGLLNRALGMRSPIIDIEHLQLFSPESVSTLLREAGFDHIRVQTITNTYPLRYWLRLTPMHDKLKNRVENVLKRFGAAEVRIPLNVGNLLAVGQKAIGSSK